MVLGHRVYLIILLCRGCMAAECVPVTKLDSYELGSGKIGPVTARILARFQELTQHTGTEF